MGNISDTLKIYPAIVDNFELLSNTHGYGVQEFDISTTITVRMYVTTKIDSQKHIWTADSNLFPVQVGDDIAFVEVLGKKVGFVNYSRNTYYFVPLYQPYYDFFDNMMLWGFICAVACLAVFIYYAPWTPAIVELSIVAFSVLGYSYQTYHEYNKHELLYPDKWNQNEYHELMCTILNNGIICESIGNNNIFFQVENSAS